MVIILLNYCVNLIFITRFYYTILLHHPFYFVTIYCQHWLSVFRLTSTPSCLLFSDRSTRFLIQMSSYQATEALIDAGDDLVEEIIKSQYNHSHINPHGQSSNTQHTTTHPSNYNSTSIESSSEDESNLESNLEDDLYDVYGKSFQNSLIPSLCPYPALYVPIINSCFRNRIVYNWFFGFDCLGS